MKLVNLFCVCLLVFLACFVRKSAYAQQDEQMSIYMYNPLYFNPAYAGSRDAISVSAVGRFQWVNFKGAPTSQWISVHTPLQTKNFGVGLHMVNDKIGKRHRTSVYADASANIVLDRKGENRISVGLSLGMDMLGFDFANSVVKDVNDPYYGLKSSATRPNVGAGVYYYGERHYVGFSLPRVLKTSIRAYNDVIKEIGTQHMFLAAGYVFDINSVLKFKPSTLLKYTPKAPLTLDLNASLLSYDRLWTGLMYRYHESIGLNVGVIINNFTVGYVFDFPIHGLMRHQYGSHEVFMQFDIYTGTKRHYLSPRHF